MTYNGWSNKETWLVALWFAHNEYDSERLRELVERESEGFYDKWPNFTPGEPVDADDYDEIQADKLELISNVAQLLKETVESAVDEALDENGLNGGFILDAINNTLSAIDWYEWAENLLEF